MPDWKDFLSQFYFNPQHPGAFAGPKKLQQILEQNNLYTPIKKIRTWLQDQDPYSLLKPVRYRFKRRRIVTTGIDDIWDADLADVSNVAKHNSDLRFWLVVIDLFSRHLWIVPVESKHHTHMLKAFRTLFNQTARRPKNLRTDKGTEFTNRAVKKLLKDENINAYTTKNETKANYAERVIRTMKGLVYRYFIHKQTYNYTDVLQELVHNYNNRPHRSLGGLPPNEIDEKNEAKVWKSMYIDTVKPKRIKKPFAFHVGDPVHISQLKYPSKRDKKKSTKEIFKITHRLRKEGVNLYMLKNSKDKVIDQYFYEEELERLTKEKRKKKPFKFKVGNHVRISHLKFIFQRDYQQKWTEEIFKITHRVRKEDFNLYMLKDLLDEVVDGYFYEVELQRITKDPSTSVFRVEKVLKQRRRQGQQELFVKWMGWPKKFNGWVLAADVQRY